jgi:hypothetical protein
MKRWTYTNDIHDFVWVDNERFMLDTAYDNIFRLFRYLEQKPTYDTFFATIIKKNDHERFNRLTKDWKRSEFNDLMNFIMREFIIDDVKENKKKVTDIYKDAELIFASFYYDYGVSLIEKKGKMTWKEFIILCSNLSEKSPLGRAVSLVQTPDKELSAEGKREKHKRIKMLNEDINLDGQLDNLASFLSATAKR